MKGQITGQIFVYLFAIIAATAIIAFGYKAISSLNEAQRCAADLSSFKSQLQNELKADMNYGTERTNVRILNAPSGYDSICFADVDDENKAAWIDDPQINAIIKDSVNSGIKKNVFMITKGKACDDDSYYIQGLDVNGDYGCFDTIKGALTINAVGCGNRVMIVTDSDLDTYRGQLTRVCRE